MPAGLGTRAVTNFPVGVNLSWDSSGKPWSKTAGRRAGQILPGGKMASYVILNIVLDCLVAAGVVGLLMWSVITHHRDPGCEGVRLPLRLRRRGLRISVRLDASDEDPGVRHRLFGSPDVTLPRSDPADSRLTLPNA